MVDKRDKRIERRKIKKKNKGLRTKVITFFIIILTIIVGIFYFSYHNYDKNKKLMSRDDISIYIKETDKISNGKLQLNWKQIAAIDGAIKDNDFTSIKEEDIKSIGNKFLNKKSVDGQATYTLKSFNEVLKEMNLSKKQIRKAESNLERLKNEGLVPGNLNSESSNKQFIEEITPAAIDIYKKYKILPSVVISQAILESGWGKSKLSEEGNNLFGIKADKSWDGKKIKMSTKENYDDKINDYFRVYNSKKQSIEDYGKFLATHKRYKESGVFKGKTYIEQITSIENAGYSTVSDKNGKLIYKDLLTSVIRENDLQLIDYEVEKG
ncbi:glycoside hydrolase family 73 protein [Clostridium fallax]|uniref:Flagellum-specific peptidoglycan hydrolase FlgJ n=1 Tax=Clostridium fallax TaxID=1533 RepID=A0A1M4U9M8_9CLOT|nr:glucosaminidase domain-containing protein [Clostridium fallax]SHE53270.1 Flagellum-specific peptidoglycan hydrolase FlgJ [Clostridium fallax]SQB06143.1 mannosyl-glycoprotein endo-beta-N-acetylglucosamidase [Clostridium fallax]